MRRALPHALAGALVTVAAACVAAPAHAASWTDADYFRAADRLQERLEPWWSDKKLLFSNKDGASETMFNADMLLVYSVAAMHGHQGPARQDDRARVLAQKLVGTPPFVTAIDHNAYGQLHAPGWIGSMQSDRGMQHLVVDAEVAEALAAAWRARAAIGLDPRVAAQIAIALRGVARSPFYRYPALRLNQINWYTTIYTAAAITNRDPSYLRRDLRAQVTRFVAGIVRPKRGTAGNLGAGMRFHYLPASPPSRPLNLDSPEYANLVASFARNWDAARIAGMAGLSGAERTVLRRWMVRVLCGYWTHAGYLNWDTGFGFRRLHQAKKLGLAQEGLLAIAAGGELSPGRRYAEWAKSVLDRGIGLYLRWLPEKDGLPPAELFDLTAGPQPAVHATLAAARIAANAARAVDEGLGRRRSRTPPPLYAYDPDVGRLAITTPRYSTAIVPVNQHAFPYGGIDIARLFDGRQEVAANIGGVPTASFGMVVRGGGGHALLATQRARRDAVRSGPPLRLVHAPSGVDVSPRSPPMRVFAGPFHALEATGTARAGSQSARSTYTFRRGSIDADWHFAASRTARRTVQLQFPSWGGHAARVLAIRTDGSEREIVNFRSLRGVRWFYVQSERSGYAVVPRRVPARTLARIVRPHRQTSEPRPGPTLVLELARRSHIRALRAGVRLVPAPDLATARERVRELR